MLYNTEIGNKLLALEEDQSWLNEMRNRPTGLKKEKVAPERLKKQATAGDILVFGLSKRR